MLRRARPRCPRSRHARPPDLRSCRARTRCLLLRHAWPRCLPLRLPRCTGVVRRRHRRRSGTFSRCRCTGVDTGTAFCSGGSWDVYTGAVAAAASSGSLSSRAGGVPPASHPSGSSAYPSHGDSADGVSGRDSIRHRGGAAGPSGTLLCPRRLGGSSLASRDRRGVRGSSCQPDVGPCAASVWLQCGDWQVDLNA